VKDLVGRLFRSLPSLSRGQTRGGPDPLAGEVVRMYEAGRFFEAAEAARRLVASRRARYGDRHPEVAAALTSLAVLLQRQGELDAAEPLFHEALDIRWEMLGETHPQYAASLGYLADVLQQKGDLDAAEPLMRRALELRKETVGEQHPDYAAGLTALALLLHRRGDPTAAEPLLRQALAIRREALGERHPITATAHSNVGRVLHHRGDLAAAEPLLREALSIRREALGERHPETGASLAHLGSLLFDRRDYNAAEPLLHEAVKVHTASLGAQHPEVLSDRRALEALQRTRAAASTPPTTQTKPPPEPPTPPPTPVAPKAGPPQPTPSEPPQSPVKAPIATSVAAEPVASATPKPVPAPGFRRAEELAEEARRLSKAFATAAERLDESARRMRDGLAPDVATLGEATALERALSRLRDEAHQRASAVQMGPPAGQSHDPLTLPALATLLDRVAAEEVERPRREAARREALALVDHISKLRHRINPASDRLRAVFDAAAAIRSTIVAAKPTDSPAPEVARLLDGTHPLAELLRLLDASKLDDVAWAQTYHAVQSAYGGPVAAAAARGRLATAGDARHQSTTTDSSTLSANGAARHPTTTMDARPERGRPSLG
jgi:tetratricopeptide (TPR) repeat protein